MGKGQEPETRAEPARDLVRGAFDAIQEAEQGMAKALTVQSMVERAEAKAPEPMPV